MSNERMAERLLIVDDEIDVRNLLARYFGAQGFATVTAASGEEMRRELRRNHVDLVLLDLGLPDEDGLAITRHLRETWQGPVVIVTGRGESVDRIVGLELGADDYVTKPFDLRELLARVRSVLRRARPATSGRPTDDPPVFAFSGYTLDTRARTLVGADGRSVDLTTGEYALLRLFVDRPNHVLSRDELMSQLYGREAGPYDRAIDAQVGRLRRKIEPDPEQPRLIKSVRGAGYVFTAAVRPS